MPPSKQHASSFDPNLPLSFPCRFLAFETRFDPALPDPLFGTPVDKSLKIWKTSLGQLSTDCSNLTRPSDREMQLVLLGSARGLIVPGACNGHAVSSN